MNKPTKTIWSIDQMPDLTGKVAVITGANSGLGYETTKALAMAGATVVMGCRDLTKGKEAAAEIRKSIPAAKLDVVAINLGDLKSVRAFAAEVSNHYPSIDILCDNAGVMAVPYPKRTLTADGFEMHMGINYLGHFALTGLLFNSLRRSPAARVVVVTSSAHGTAKLDLDDLQGERDFSHQYANSKLADLMFAYELDRRLKRASVSNVIAVACHPGAANTHLVSGASAMSGTKPAWWLKLLFSTMQSSTEGAKSEICAAVWQDVHGGDLIGPSGFMQSRGLPTKVEPKPLARDEKAARKLWELSERLTNVKYL